MKVLFAYINSTKSFDLPLGIAYLSGMLKAHSFKTDLLDLTWQNHEGFLSESCYRESKMRGADILALSSTTLEFPIALNVAEQWKQVNDGPVVMGGCQPTIEPEKSLSSPFVDAICIGEGEYPLAAFVEQYERLEDLDQMYVKNFWIKTSRGVEKYPLGVLPDLDGLPFPDRSIFDKRHVELWYPGSAFLTSRGCPFHCSMCINHYLQKLYAGLGEYTRFRSVDSLFQEINEVKAAYNLQRLFFIDDTFTINHFRLQEFLRRYKKEVDLPFLIMGRCNTVDRELVQQLADAGCIYMGFGVESGNQTVRDSILKRGMTDEQIINAFRWAKEAGVYTASYNMMGIPNESRKEMFETIELNRKIKPDVVQTTLLYPFPKTEIYDVAKQQGLLSEDNPGQTEYYTKSIIKNNEMNSKQLAALVLAVPYYVHFPKFLWSLVRVLEWLFTKTRKLDVAARVFRKHVLEREFFKKGGLPTKKCKRCGKLTPTFDWTCSNCSGYEFE